MIETLYEHYLNASGISTDTRTIRPDAIFFALKGSRFNANQLAEEAFDKGASMVVIDEVRFKKDSRYFLVNDSLEALQQLAGHHRRQLSIPVIGITGSNGKTTTKELVRDVLATRYRVLATPGNFNNHIGVPLTLLAIQPDREVAIIEMGANHVGEIAALCRIASPTHGLITNIGKAHLEGFGGMEGVIRGKGELYDHLTAHNGTLFVNSGNELLADMAGQRVKHPVRYPNKGDYFHASLVESNPLIRYRDEQGAVVRTSMTGIYNFENICAALCIGKYFGVEARKANEAVAGYVAHNNRSQIIRKDKKTIILDAYNANPTSMAAALKNLVETKTGYSAAIIGDMLELGEASAAEHAAIGALTKALAIDAVFFCGPQMQHAYRENPDGFYFRSKDDLATHLENHSWEEVTVLIKGSRSMGLETLVASIGG